jgi:amidase
MRRFLPLLFLVPGLVLAQDSASHQPKKPGLANTDLSGRWIVTADLYGTPINLSLELKQEGDKLSGKFGSNKLEGALGGNSIRFVAKDEQDDTQAVPGHSIS